MVLADLPLGVESYLSRVCEEHWFLLSYVTIFLADRIQNRSFRRRSGYWNESVLRERDHRFDEKLLFDGFSKIFEIVGIQYCFVQYDQDFAATPLHGS